MNSDFTRYPGTLCLNIGLSRKERILKALQTGDESASNLARICDCPTASVRRTIQELRASGHNICFADVHEQIYRLGV